MEDLTIAFVTGICVYGFYKLIELFVRRRERLLLVEKLSGIESPEGIKLPSLYDGENMGRFMALRAGALIAGLGLGLLVGYIIATCTMPENYEALTHDAYHRLLNMVDVLYGASTLLFGGLGLLIAFVVEWKMRQK